MKATLSVDHRVSDGAEAAQFMQKLAEFLENPVRIMDVGVKSCRSRFSMMLV
jgi:pyruvate/2-oxoglutarate dehydrogenase complex dihydrolipoamide acyltransferase (E2) component